LTKKLKHSRVKGSQGAGEILALTNMLEVGKIGSVKEVGNYSSYEKRRKKEDEIVRTGNKYLSWA